MVDKNNGKSNGNNGPQGTGWQDARAQQAQAFFRCDNGASVQGVLIGRFPKPGGRQNQFIYQIRTTEPCQAMVRIADKEYELQDVPIGTLVSIDEKTALEGLRELLADEDKWEVFIRSDEKRKLNNGNHFWDFTIQKRPAPLSFDTSPVNTATVNDDDVPY